MPYLVGIDEAGYGPNLGPLVIGASVWRAPEIFRAEEMYGLLQEVIVDQSTPPGDPAHLAIADSKSLYSSTSGVSQLERGVYSMLQVLGMTPRTWQDLWRALAPGALETVGSSPWIGDYDEPAPREVSIHLIETLTKAVSNGLKGQQIELVQFRCTAVFPPTFNDLIDEHQNKSTLLSHVSLTLAAEVLTSLQAKSPSEPIYVGCDKHGGRNRYGPLLQHFFPEHLVEIYGEGRQESVYRFGPSSQRVEIRFTAGGERFLPSALASMGCKLLREMAMTALNRFWQQHLPNLKPTAGYPVDARRFKKEIAAVQTLLNIPDHILWRSR